MAEAGSDGVEYYTEERCHILEFLNTEAAPDASIARARVEAGVTTKRHRVAGTVERYVIVSGQGTAYVEGREPEPVTAGDVVIIPAGAAQAIANTSDADLVFMCICTPRFEWDNYESLE